MNVAHEPRFADSMVQRTVSIECNERIAQDTFRLRFECLPMAQQIVPGQFLMLRIDGCDDPLIGRPLALYDTVLGADQSPTGIDVVYLVKGKLTTRLKELRPGQSIQVWGPLGNGFPVAPVDHLIMVAGGIGQTPFVALASEYLGRRCYGDPPRTPMHEALANRVTLCYGARSANHLAGVEDFASIGVDVQLSTDDGSRGRAGFVTELLQELLAHGAGNCRVVCCGPEPMMAAVAEIAERYRVPCQVSLETPMACGIGICFTCVARLRDGDLWDYRRTCVEGPVFDAANIVW